MISLTDEPSLILRAELARKSSVSGAGQHHTDRCHWRSLTASTTTAAPLDPPKSHTADL